MRRSGSSTTPCSSAATIWILFGLDAFTGSYENLAGRLPFLPDGQSAALWFTAGTIVAWTVFASTIQVIVYRRGLRNWPESRHDELEQHEQDSRSV